MVGGHDVPGGEFCYRNLGEREGIGSSIPNFEPRKRSKHDYRQTGCRFINVRNRVSIMNGAASYVLTWTTLTVLFSAAPAFAVEQCRFIQAKPEREACYQRQAAELAAKRKPDPPRGSETMQSLEQMKHEDEALNRQLHSICRGC
jgi:hypothetical protein